MPSPMLPVALAFLHKAIMRSTRAFARRPARTDYIGRFAIDAVRRIDGEFAAMSFVHTRGAHVRVQVCDRGRDTCADDEVRRDVVACRVAGPEIRLEFVECQRTIGHNGDSAARPSARGTSASARESILRPKRMPTVNAIVAALMPPA